MILFSGISEATTKSVTMKKRPPMNPTHGATRAPSINNELIALYNDDDSELTFICNTDNHQFNYVVSNLEGDHSLMGDGTFGNDGMYVLSIDNLPSGTYTIYIIIGSVTYQGEFEIE